MSCSFVYGSVRLLLPFVTVLEEKKSYHRKLISSHTVETHGMVPPFKEKTGK